MKKIFLIVSTIISVCVLSNCTNNKNILPFVYVDYKNGVELYRYISDEKYIESIDIPDEYNGKKVIRIEDAAFNDVYSIQKLKLPECLEEIGDDVFTGQNEIHIKNVPNTIKIVGQSNLASKEVSRYNLLKNNPDFKVTDNAVFSSDGKILISYDSSRKSEDYIIPNGVKTIAENAFFNAENLKKVVIPEGVETLEHNAFLGCKNLTNISFPKSLKHMEADSVSETKWYKKQKGEVIINGKFLIKETENVGQQYKIPDGITHLLCDFYDYDEDEENVPYLSVLTLPKSLEYISPDIDLTNVSIYQIENGNYNFIIDNNGTILYNKDKTKLVKYSKGNVQRLVLEDNIKTIGENAFNFSTISNLILPDSLEKIEKYAFISSNLKEINIPKKIKTIEEGTFAECYEIKECKIPNSVERIERYAFSDIDDLEITIPDSVKYIHPQAFDNSEDLKIVGKKNSFAEKYAEIFNIDFKEID